MNKTLLYLTGIVLLVIFSAYFFLKSSTSEITTGNVIANNPSGAQTQNIVLTLRNYNYYPNTITVNANQPVRISLDASVAGCLRDFTIPDFKIHQYLKTPQDYVEFTPTAPGTYHFACSMGMGTGTLIVK